jgi:hypothetical protein
MAGANSNIQLTELDFNNIKNNLKTFLQSQDVLKDYNYEGSALSTLLDILAYNTQYNAYYLNMVANEMFLDTAIQRDSVVSQAKLLNYTPKSATAPQAIVNFRVNQVSDSTLSLPKFTPFLSEAIDGINYNFVAADTYTTSVSANTAVFNNVVLKQGIRSSISYVVNSVQNPKYIFEIPNQNVDINTLSVIVAESSPSSSSTVYTRATNYLSLDSTSTVYFLQEGKGGKYEIYFGDDILGKKLVDGQSVFMEYLVTQGVSATGANNFTLMGNISGYANTSVQPLVAATQGSGKESIDSIKFQAPKSYSAQGRAVTKEDYITAIKQNSLGYALDAVSVWGGEENDPPVFGQAFIAIKPAGGYLLTDTQKERLIQDVIKPISVVTVEPTIVDPDYTYINVTSNVLYDPKKTTRSAQQLQSLVKNAIYNFGDTTLNSFNSTFVQSDLVNLIKNIDYSIVACEISIDVQKKFLPNLTTPTTYKLYYGSPLSKGIFSSSVRSNPSMQYRNPENASLVIDGVYLEEEPSPTAGLSSVQITNPGFGYQSTPTVTIYGDGTGATAMAVLSTSGTVREIKVTNAGSGYTSAVVVVTPAAGDTTGQLCSAVAVLEGQFGNLRLYYNNVNTGKSFITKNAGTIDYVNGVITLDSFNPLSINDPLGQLTVTAKPTTSIISSTYNRIITIDQFDPTSVVVNISAKS